ncbi:MAG: hypothetical protein ACC653_03245 [Gammaproteobacteria bacterium]
MNTYQLVIRSDTANGYFKVGWASELPLGRFEHVELLLEVDNVFELKSKNHHSVTYLDACKRVSALNQSLIIKEQQANLASGWFNVLLNLNDGAIKITADELGCFNNLATETRYRLSKNCRVVWAMIYENTVQHIEARYPELNMGELKYQIWKHHKLEKLQSGNGELKQGKLIVSYSGLWFVADVSV